jgi:hypothetical protein
LYSLKGTERYSSGSKERLLTTTARSKADTESQDIKAASEPVIRLMSSILSVKITGMRTNWLDNFLHCAF